MDRSRARGIVWGTITNGASADHGNTGGAIYAYNAETLELLWSSQQNVKRDRLGTLMKFVVPIVANGKVYIPTYDNAVNVYGLLSPIDLQPPFCVRPLGTRCSHGSPRAMRGRALRWTTPNRDHPKDVSRSIACRRCNGASNSPRRAATRRSNSRSISVTAVCRRSPSSGFVRPHRVHKGTKVERLRHTLAGIRAAISRNNPPSRHRYGKMRLIRRGRAQHLHASFERGAFVELMRESLAATRRALPRRAPRRTAPAPDAPPSAD